MIQVQVLDNLRQEKLSIIVFGILIEFLQIKSEKFISYAFHPLCNSKDELHI